MLIHSAPVIDCDLRTVLKTGRSIQPESQIDAADPNRGICATECCMIAVGYVFWLLENDESMGFFRSFFCGMMFEFSEKRSERQAAQNGAKNHIGRPNRRGSSRTGFRDSYRPGGIYVSRGRKTEDGRVDDRYNLVELSTSSYPARTRRNIEESDGTVIFSLNRRLSGGTKLTLELANKLGKPVLHIYDTRKERISNSDSLRLEIKR
jgi:hypothetical protein